MDRRKNKEVYLEDMNRVLRRQFKTFEDASDEDLYHAVTAVSMDRVLEPWKRTTEMYELCQLKQVNEFSMEFLPGRLHGNNLANCGNVETVREILRDRNISLNHIEELEEEPALGNGGLGRLVSCKMESLATQGYHACGYSIKYKKGFFEQRIVNGYQAELPAYWEEDEDARYIKRKEFSQKVVFGGEDNKEIVEAIAYDMPIIGYPMAGREQVKVSTLRLWGTEKDSEITNTLYPDDTTRDGKVLRLKQQYFLTSASVQLIWQQFKKHYKKTEMFPKKVCLHLNDTHPVLVIPELMRILMDEEGFSWDEAWTITTKSCTYTNHTLLAESLETWDIDLFEGLLPRIYEIVHEIDKRFVKHLRTTMSDAEEKVKNMAILYDGKVRMAHLAIIGSFSVNGVAKLHTEIMQKRELIDFNELMGHKFHNVTNGITPRRWLHDSNPWLSQWITEKSGYHNWVTDMDKVKRIERFADDAVSQQEFMSIKHKNKIRLANIIKAQTGIVVDPNAIFDVQVKRIHEYKRQLMNVLRIRCLYQELKENPVFFENFHPMVFIFAGKAHPNYKEAKLIIHEIIKLAEEVNNDAAIKGTIKVVFLENYNVSLAEKIFPASDVSEQISTASKEASGTGNMKFMMNGALTLGTLDGANVEIMDAVGRDNMFIFGATSDEIIRHEKNKDYIPRDIYENDEAIQTAVDRLCPALRNSLIGNDDSQVPADRYFVLLDLKDYVCVTLEMNRIYKNANEWARMTILNVANSGQFSIDRTVREYKEIWGLESIYEN